MYSLLHVARLAWKKLNNLLIKYNYKQSSIIPDLWQFTHLNLAFALIVNDFGIKYVNKKDFNKLISTIFTIFQNLNLLPKLRQI